MIAVITVGVLPLPRMPGYIVRATATARRKTTANQALIHLNIIVCHAARCEALLETFPATCATEIGNAPNCFGRVLQFFNYKPCSPIFYHFGNCSTIVCDHWSPAGHRLDHYQAERLRPVDGKQQCVGISEEFVLLLITDFTDPFRHRRVT